MSLQYLYNKKTGKLHIKGYCHHTKGPCDEYIRFYTEKDVLAHDGRAVSLCKICESKRELLIKKQGEML